MKRKAWLMVFGFLMISSIALAAKVKIITQEAMIRKDKRFFAPAVVSVPYGAVIDELEKQGDWLRVSYQGQQGWLHVSAVQEQNFNLSTLSDQKAQETSNEEVALAGKGFTSEVETAFREKNPKMRYDLVDQVQGYQVSESELLAFIQAGDLKTGGGEP
jgi:hypothetical protein